MSIPESFLLGIYEYRFCGAANVERVFAHDVVTGQPAQEAEQ